MIPLLLSAFIATICVAWNTAHGGPRLVLERDYIVVRPEIFDSNDVAQTFTLPIRNSGDQNLTINVVGTRSDVIENVTYPDTLGPNEEGRITLEINAEKAKKKAPGTHETIPVHTNDPQREGLVINISFGRKREGEDIAISQTQVIKWLSPGEFNTPYLKERIYVFDRWDKNLELRFFESSPNIRLSSYDIRHRCPTGGGKHWYRLDTTLETIEDANELHGWIQFATNHPDYPTIRIPITYKRRSTIRFSPKVLIFDRNKDISKKTVRVWNADNKGRLEVSQTLASHPLVTVEKTRIAPSTLEFSISVAPLKEQSPISNSKIEITLDAPERGRVVTIDIVML